MSAPGDFPFPVSDGPHESRYLTWIRNHSNYMAVRGLLDYFRAAGVLVRGVAVNALIALPPLLVAGMAVAFFRINDVPPFIATQAALAVTAVWILLFPVLTMLFRIARYRRSLETGSDSSIKVRNRYERSFGFLLLLTAGLAAFEALPFFLDRYHALVTGRLGWPHFATLIGGAIAIFSAGDKVLTMFRGLVGKIVLVVIGAVGLVVPLMVVMMAADFLVFPHYFMTGPTFSVAAAALPVGLIIGLIVGLAARAFSFKDLAVVVGLLIGSAGLLALSTAADAQIWTLGPTLDAQLDKASEWIPLTADYDRLTGDVAAHPGPVVNEFLEYMERDRSLGMRTFADIPPANMLSDSLRLYQAEGPQNTFFGLDRLAEAVSKDLADIQRDVEPEIRRLDDRFMRSLAVLRQPTAKDTVRAIMDPPAQHFEFIGGGSPDSSGTADAYPVLRKAHPDELAHVERDFEETADLLMAMRRSIAIDAVASRRYPSIYDADDAHDVRQTGFIVKLIMVGMTAVLLWSFCWMTVDVNLTSIHGLYRDRLASAFLIGIDTKGDIDIEEDLDLEEMARHDAGSIAPYHLLNVAINLQSSRDMSIRDRQSDYFIFSKKFTGSERTGYGRSETMERVFPQMNVSAAMAISAAAAAPNMGRGTNPVLVALMTLLNVRMGVWVPNPGRVEHALGGPEKGFTFDEVFRDELVEVERRWANLPVDSGRRLAENVTTRSVSHGLVGLAFSGGGIRSATVNLGIAQELHRRGVFDHVDYMSTVSGGGYLGSSISAIMRRRTKTTSEIAGRVDIRTDGNATIVTVTPEGSGAPAIYRYAPYAVLAVKDGAAVAAGQRLIKMGGVAARGLGSFREQFRWRVRPGALLKEMTGRLHEGARWVNVSDGGHIENLAGIELLRRRCKFIILGDGEADPDHGFNGLATLIRSARIDLGVHIDMNVDALRLDTGRFCKGHWAVGRIHYPADAETGYVLYLKSSVTGNEDEVIREYRHAHATFPHESTADQMFDEGQFEAYRSLGQHIAQEAMTELAVPGAGAPPLRPFKEIADWFEGLAPD